MYYAQGFISIILFNPRFLWHFYSSFSDENISDESQLREVAGQVQDHTANNRVNLEPKLAGTRAQSCNLCTTQLPQAQQDTSELRQAWLIATLNTLRFVLCGHPQSPAPTEGKCSAQCQTAGTKEKGRMECGHQKQKQEGTRWEHYKHRDTHIAKEEKTATVVWLNALMIRWIHRRIYHYEDLLFCWQNVYC